MEHWMGVGRVARARFEEEFVGDFGPEKVVFDELVFEEVDPRTLVFLFAYVVSIVVEGDLTRGVLPRFKLVVGCDVFPDLVEVVCGAVEKIC